MARVLYRSVFVAMLFAVPALAGAADRTAALEPQVAVEERLLGEALGGFADARIEQKAAQAALAEASQRFDLTVAQASSTALQLDQVERERQVALAAATVIDLKVEQLRNRVIDQLRRTAALRAELARSVPLNRPAQDLVTGRWRIEISSPPQVGTFDLVLNGAQVTGTYAFDNGRKGSVTGTFAGGRLRLQRIDSERGLDGVLEGDVDGALGTARGFFNPAELGAGGPAGSGWSGVRVSNPPSAAPAIPPGANP